MRRNFGYLYLYYSLSALENKSYLSLTSYICAQNACANPEKCLGLGGGGDLRNNFVFKGGGPAYFRKFYNVTIYKFEFSRGGQTPPSL